MELPRAALTAAEMRAKTIREGNKAMDNDERRGTIYYCAAWLAMLGLVSIFIGVEVLNTPALPIDPPRLRFARLSFIIIGVPAIIIAALFSLYAHFALDSSDPNASEDGD